MKKFSLVIVIAVLFVLGCVETTLGISDFLPPIRGSVIPIGMSAEETVRFFFEQLLLEQYGNINYTTYIGFDNFPEGIYFRLVGSESGISSESNVEYFDPHSLDNGSFYSVAIVRAEADFDFFMYFLLFKSDAGSDWVLLMSS